MHVKDSSDMRPPASSDMPALDVDRLADEAWRQLPLSERAARRADRLWLSPHRLGRAVLHLDAKLVALLRHRRQRLDSSRRSPAASGESGVSGPAGRPPGVLWRMGHRLYRAQVAGGVRRVRWARQRLVRGWDDRHVFNLGHALASQLADQLDMLASDASSWPGPQHGYDTEEQWIGELRANARALRLYGDSSWQFPAAQAFPAGFGPRGSAGREAEVLADAQDALRWVADKLHLLWD
jgi:hypothetical protein